MHIDIIGPNLRDQSKGQFHVHRTGCSDVRKYGPNGPLGGEEPWTVNVDSRREAVEAVYDDHMAEGASYESCRSDLHFCPCLADLPEEAPRDEVEYECVLSAAKALRPDQQRDLVAALFETRAGL